MKDTPERPARPLLQTLFSERRTDFQARLAKAQTLSEAAEVIDALLTELRGLWIESLPVRLARLGSRAFVMLGSVPQQLRAMDKMEHEVRALAVAPADAGAGASTHLGRMVSTLIKTGLTGAALWCALHVAFSDSWVILSLMLLLGGLLCLLGLELLGQLFAWWSRRRRSAFFWALLGWQSDAPAALPAPPSYEVKSHLIVDSSTISAALMDALAALDHAVADLDVTPAEVSDPTLAGFADILELFQKLITAERHKDAPRALSIAGDVRGILLAAGLRAQFFEKGRNEEFFDVEPAPAPNITTYVTDLVALVGDKGVVRRGRVVEPWGA